MVVISADRNTEKIHMAQPVSKHIYDPCNATEGSRINAALPFHSFKVTLGEVL